MKRILFFSCLLLFSLFSIAQDIWVEGTSWSVYYQDGRQATFVLEGTTEIEGVEYLNVIHQESKNCLGYIRTEQGDSLVYCRLQRKEEVSAEYLLYDFTRSYDLGGILQYLTYNAEIQQITTQSTEIVPEEVVWLHDVMEEGDSYPMWNGFIYKIGTIYGPLGTLVDNVLWVVYSADPTEFKPRPKPKPEDVSHIVVKMRRKTIPFMESDLETSTAIPYSLSGMRLWGTPSGTVFIQNRKKIIKK